MSNLIDARESNTVHRIEAVVSAEEARAMLEPGDILVDCTGSRSLLRDHLVPGSDETDSGTNTLNIRLEYALVITFLYSHMYECNEYCKYYKNVENAHYKFIPSVHRTYHDGNITSRDRHRKHHGRRVRRDALAIRRRVAPRATSRAWPSRWTASSTRSNKRPRARSSAI